MTALGFLYPGHSAEDDYPRIEQLLGSDIRVDLVHTDIGEDAHRVDALREMGAPERLAAGCEALRLAGAEAVVWACTSGSFVYGYEGAHDQIRTLAVTAGMPASSTSFAFAHAVGEVGAHRVAVAATYPDDVAQLFADFLGASGVEVVSLHGAGVITAAEVATWTVDDILGLARTADHERADAILLPDTALHTASHIPTLEKELSKPVLTANQVSVWEALRLTDRRVNAPELGALFTREPIVQV
ncbi:maleate cis-trans isomerase family protein [Streptomyces capitiformicae]|uniref:Decarboxylase n=1 Tax=Streptomyces capitiformicae TaxID=2014920 RepID=A0A919DAC9_9ACTN|nr:aspartate/glutamate racemase family protein [Streptomyces capitiformicae]GHE27574.1 decarboxylase [Streptomyces capitiformicae]